MKFAEKYDHILKVLNRSEKIRSYDSRKQTEADVLAHSLLDIEESCKEIVDVLLPKFFTSENDENDIDEILQDIGDELKHIIYHTRTPKYYEYLHGFNNLNEENN